jgi:oxalate decarboxylase/phosphoglucose isomerase-like protein (cupin superfamily)
MLDPTVLVTHGDQLPMETFDWGTLQWICNGSLLPGTSQTVGICHLHPGKSNPLHYHPNCEEILHVISGHGKHLLDDQWVPVKPGTTVRIPIGMKHQLVNEGTLPIATFIVFSSADRQTVFLE